MKTMLARFVRRLLGVVALTAGLGGCAVYAPPYAYDGAYAPYSYPTYGYPAYGYPAYVAPPISLDLGFGYYRGHGDGGYRGSGWRAARPGDGHRYGGPRRSGRR